MRNKGGLLINKINFLSGRVFNKILRDSEKSNLNQAQARILFMISRHKNQMSIQELCRELGVSKSTMTSMLERLTEKGYLNKGHAIADKRITMLSTTEKANKEIKLFESILIEMQATFYADFTEDEIAVFENLLARIYKNLENAGE